MEKDLKLVNIYIRIHNKQTITIDDLAYLARYNPTCFKKTCDNLIYKVPKAKALVEPPVNHAPAVPAEVKEEKQGNAPSVFDRTAGEELQDRYVVQQMIKSLKEMEEDEVEALQNIDITEVKELLGGLFMESLFPHSGLPEYFDICKEENGTLFSAKA